MIKKSLNHFLIAGVNLLILTLLLLLWTDKLELAFSPLARPIEFSKIIGLTVLALVGMRILVHISDKRTTSESKRKRLLYSILFTMAISSFFYVNYGLKTYRCLFDQTRQTLAEKIKDTQTMANGTMADNLTYKEYALLAEIGRFPKVPETAEKISYSHAYDGSLPDYTFQLRYEVPLETDIEIIDFKKGHFSKSQTLIIKGNRKLVTYEEGEW